MKKISVQIPSSPARNYDIHIGSDLIDKVDTLIDFRKYTHAAIITDPNLARYHLQKLEDSLPISSSVVLIPPGERGKTISTVTKIWQQLADAKVDRKSVIINFGGGAIGDIGGFTASTYMRGIDFINIPTTILAQADESVGGKTGIDYAGFKNLIGTYRQPAAVIADVETLKTLPDREYISGFAEVIKHGLIADKQFFEKVTAKRPLDFTSAELVEIIAGACEIKRKVVEEDTTEKGLRKTLNFGHTLGHAIEALSLDTDKHLLHGEAVSIGMVAEAKLSQLRNYISEEDVQLIKQTLTQAGLPIVVKKMKTKEIISKMRADKKTISGIVKWTLLKKIGEAAYDEEIEDALVTQAIDFISNE